MQAKALSTCDIMQIRSWTKINRLHNKNYNWILQQQAYCAQHPCMIADLLQSPSCNWIEEHNKKAQKCSTDDFLAGQSKPFLVEIRMHRSRGDTEYQFYCPLYLLQLVWWDERLVLVSCIWCSVHATQPWGLYRHKRGLLQGGESLVSFTIAP